ncbi:hypothetical protein GCM10010191_05960 [Actinomadura vinacea]|uniref:Uncharacterized protein n=1 Tax=Actinomadura vinacea TaxID=115336 RepID=A0ABP5VEW2_9ACTN
MPDPVGDADHHPFGEAELVALLKSWLPERTGLIDDAVRTSRELPGMPMWATPCALAATPIHLPSEESARPPGVRRRRDHRRPRGPLPAARAVTRPRRPIRLRISM